MLLQEYRQGTMVSWVLAVEMDGSKADPGYFRGIVGRNLWYTGYRGWKMGWYQGWILISLGGAI